MTAIEPRFNFTQEVPVAGGSQTHNSTNTLNDAVRPELFNEYERVMMNLSRAMGDLEFTYGNDPDGGPITDISTAIQVLISNNSKSFTTDTLTVNGSANIGAIKLQWKNNTHYYVDNLVVADGKLYKCTTEHQSVTSGIFALDQAKWSMIGGGGGTTMDITKFNHGFDVGQVLFFQDEYKLAKANSHSTLGLFMVSNYVDANNFTIIQAGYFKIPAGKSIANAMQNGATVFTPNTWYYLSDTQAGKLTSVEPTLSNPILYAISTTEAFVVGFRPQNATRSNVFEFTYEAGQSNYAMPFAPDSFNGSILSIDGVIQPSIKYSFTGKVLNLVDTFTPGAKGRLFYLYSFPSKTSTMIYPYRFITSGDTTIFQLDHQPAAKEYTQVFINGQGYWDYHLEEDRLITDDPIPDNQEVRIFDFRTINIEVEMSLSQNADVLHKSLTLQQDDGIASKNGLKVHDWRIYENVTGNLVFANINPAPDTAKCTINTSGDLTANRVFNAVWNDIAECMPSDGSLVPGDLAQIDTSSERYRLTKYNGEFENYIGVVSKNPGMIVGENQRYESPIYIVLRGMVWTDKLGIHPVGTMLYLTPDGIKSRTDIRLRYSHYDVQYIGKVIESKPDKIRLFI